MAPGGTPIPKGRQSTRKSSRVVLKKSLFTTNASTNATEVAFNVEVDTRENEETGTNPGTSSFRRGMSRGESNKHQTTAKPNSNPEVNNSSGHGNHRVRRYRKMKKPTFAVFGPATGAERVRPRSVLTYQQKFATEVLKGKITGICKNSKSCLLDRCNGLCELETKLMKRLGLVSNLMVDNDDEVLHDKKYEVILIIGDKLMELQNLIETKRRELNKERERLRTKHSHFVCCGVCAKNRGNR